MCLRRLARARALAAGLVILLCSCGQKAEQAALTQSLPDSTPDSFLQTLDEQDYIAHALGGIDGHSYTNSLEALWRSYEGGARLFEADIHLTSDGKAVLVHGFAKNDYLKRIGAEYYPEEGIEAGGEYLPSFDEFMAFEIQGQYQPLDFSMLADFIRAHNDMYVLVDIWTQDYDGTKKTYTAICEACGYDAKVLDHLIAGGHTKEMIYAVENVYSFKHLNLYYSDEIIDDSFTTDGFIAFCSDWGIESYSIADDSFTADLFERLREGGLISYVFTVNDPERARVLLACGVDAVGSDFIRE